MKLRLEMPKVLTRLVCASVVVFLALAMAIPASATTPLAGDTGNYRGQCRRLTKQIDHFEGNILPLAVARGNRTWERATNEQIARLWHRRADLCPAYGRERTMLAIAAEEVRRINKMISVAARGAATFFSGGLSGAFLP